MAKEHTYLMLLEWNISDNGIKINFWMENGHIQTELTSKVISKIINQKVPENGVSRMGTLFRENTIK